MPIVEKLRFWQHPIDYVQLQLLKVLIGGHPVVVNVTIHRPEEPQGPMLYFPQHAKRPVFYNINLDPIDRKHHLHDPLITSNPE